MKKIELKSVFNSWCYALLSFTFPVMMEMMILSKYSLLFGNSQIGLRMIATLQRFPKNNISEVLLSGTP